MSKKVVDRGDACLDCREDTKFGSGKFVNRTPSETDEEKGYLCKDCEDKFNLDAGIVCLNCGEQSLEGNSECFECEGKEFRKIKQEDLN